MTINYTTRFGRWPNEKTRRCFAAPDRKFLHCRSRLPQLLPIFSGHIQRELEGAVGTGVERLFDDRYFAAADVGHAVFDAFVEAVHLAAAAAQHDVVAEV